MSLPTFQPFVAGDSARSRAAEANFRRFGAERLHDRYELSVVDVTKDPDRAEEERILTTPTLVKTAPGPMRLEYSQLADHVGSHATDLASMLIAIDEAGGQPTSLARDGNEIHRFVSERHGLQRRRRRLAALNEALSVVGASLRQAETIGLHALERSVEI